jgi:hypothetical protein
MDDSSSTSVLDRVLDPVMECFTPEVARRLADLRADPQLQARVDDLAEKANEGQLSAEEQGEYDRYREVYHLVTVLQAKARRFLKTQAFS